MQALDAETYRELVLRHKDRVYGYAYWMVRNAEDARDTCQEALIRMWEHRDSVRADSALPWLLRTTHRLCIDRSRRLRVRKESDRDLVEEPVADEAPGPDRLAWSTQILGRVGAALGALREVDRAALVLREVHGCSYREIAEALDVPVGTLKAKLHRVRERLRRELATAGVEP